MSKALKLPKTAGGAIGLLFKILGMVTIASPAIVAVQGDLAKNDFSTFGQDVLYQYTGYSIPGQNLNTAQLGAGVAAVGGGIALIYVGKFLSRVIR